MFRNPVRKTIVLALAVVLLVASGAFAQSTTGRLIGTVTDDNQVALPGVTVTIESDALLGGPRSEVTDVSGEYSFLGLAPGSYSVTADMSGFVSQKRTEVKVRLGQVTSLIIEMPEAKFGGEIEVTAETPVIDPTQVSSGQGFDQTYLQGSAVGSANRSYQQIVFQTGGVGSNTFDPAGGGGSNSSVFGGTVADNAYYMDGIDTTDPLVSTWGSDLQFDAIEEIQFQTGGFEAEFGRATGGVVNLVTKSGGNRFSGTLDLRYQGDSFQESGDHFDADASDSESQIYGATLGGPVVRDRLWFFVSYEYSNTDFTPTGSLTTRTFEGNRGLAKLSWQIDPSWRLVGKYQGDPADIDNSDASPFRTPEATTFQDQGGDIASFELNAVLSDSLIWNAAGAINRGELNAFPQSGDLETISHENLDTGLHWNNAENQQYSERDRDDLATDITWFVDNLAGSHEFKGGIQYAHYRDNSSNCSTGTPGGAQCTTGVNGLQFLDIDLLGDGGHFPWLLLENETASPQEFDGDLYTAYVQDSWRPVPNLTLKLGVRYDTVQWFDNQSTKVADMDKVQPRVGVAWDITGDAKNVVRGSWGRFMHPSNTSLPGFVDTTSTGTFRWLSCSGVIDLAFGIPIGSPEECAALAASQEDWQWFADADSWDPNGWIFRGAADTFAGGAPNGIDPNLDPAFADEWIIAYERALWQRSSISLTYVNKKTDDIFEDTCNGNLAEPSADADCDFYVAANLDPLEREYQGAILTFETRSLGWLTLISSYTWSESKGSADSRWNFLSDWDVYPWHWQNQYGFLGDHRDHRFKLNGFVLLPLDFTIGFDGFYSSKFVYTPQADSGDIPEIPYGTAFVEPRGSREAFDNYQFDLQVTKGFNVGAGVEVQLIASVLNLFSNEQPTQVCEDVSGCADPESAGLVDLGAPIAWQTPRRYEAGFRLIF